MRSFEVDLDDEGRAHGYSSSNHAIESFATLEGISVHAYRLSAVHCAVPCSVLRALWCSSVLCGALQCSSVLCGALRGSAVFRGVLRCSYTVNAFHEVFHLHALSVLRKMVMTVLLHWKFSTTGLLVHGVHRTHVCAPWMIINSGAFFTAMATYISLAL